jgi:hypothetical protein
MLNQEIVEHAIETAHEVCAASPNGCVHANALSKAHTAMLLDQSRLLNDAVADNMGLRDIIGLLYNHALHVGYRLHQLETDADKEQPVKAFATPVAVN